MTPVQSASEFFALVEKSRIISPNEYGTLQRTYANKMKSHSADQCASLLVQRGILTKFQADQLLRGRGHSLLLGNQFKLLDLVGSGSLGQVFRAIRVNSQQQFALKALPLERVKDAQSLEKFEAMAKTLAGFTHPNLIRTYGVLRFGKVAVQVLEFIQGPTLQTIIEGHGPMDPTKAARCVGQALLGMQAAQKLGLVHRTLKPANLFLSRDGNVKIADYGLAEYFPNRYDGETKFFREKHLHATAAYLAPELGMYEEADVRSDIYSLGGILYFLLTGQELFPRGSLAQILLSHQVRHPQPIREVRPDVPPSLATVVHRMIEKNPKDRFQSPQEVINALAEFRSRPSVGHSLAGQSKSNGLAKPISRAYDPAEESAEVEPEPRSIVPYLLIGGGAITLAAGVVLGALVL